MEREKQCEKPSVLQISRGLALSSVPMGEAPTGEPALAARER